MVFDAVLSGKTGISLPGGSLGWAFGAQYREDTFEATYSDLNNFAVTPCVNSVSTGIVGPGRARRRSSPRRPARCCSSAARPTATSIATSARCSPS